MSEPFVKIIAALPTLCRWRGVPSPQPHATCVFGCLTHIEIIQLVLEKPGTHRQCLSQTSVYWASATGARNLLLSRIGLVKKKLEKKKKERR
jgi:hypothetical protein